MQICKKMGRGTACRALPPFPPIHPILPDKVESNVFFTPVILIVVGFADFRARHAVPLPGKCRLTDPPRIEKNLGLVLSIMTGQKQGKLPEEPRQDPKWKIVRARHAVPVL
jgi:hypothetical protein